MSVAQLKRLLAPGVEFTATFVGANAHHARADIRTTRRRVSKQTHQMISEFLDGPEKGKGIWLSWKGVKVKNNEDGTFTLNHPEQPGNGDFLQITIHT